MNREINTALLQLRKRAEKYSTDQLIETFVDVGPLFTMLNNPDHQILYGRRGTGKTHVLRYLTSQKTQNGHCCINIDLRTIGSTGGIYSDESIALSERATRLLVDTLSAIHDQILDFSIERSDDINLSKIGPVLDSLADSITQVQILGPVEKENVSENEISESETSQLTLSTNPALGFGSSNSSSDRMQNRTKLFGIENHRVHFPSVQNDFAAIVKLIAPYEIWIVLDEWAEVPLELQPFLGDLIRRTLFPTYGVSVKIGAIEHRSNFRISKSTAEYIGIEIGADVTSLNLDEYMVFDNNEYLALDFFKNLIFKHVQPLLPETIKFKFPDDFVNVTFTQTNAFEEFVRASEGVPRDAINILVQAAMKSGNTKLSVNDIRSASRVWYNRDKEKAVSANNDALKLLRWIIDEVIGNRNARAFLLRTDVDSPLIEYLYDARVIHVIKQSIAGKDDPGVRYNVYSVDYGCYVDLINTSRAPKGLFEVETEDGLQFVNVPQNDYRAIRRAILDLQEFDQST